MNRRLIGWCACAIVAGVLGPTTLAKAGVIRVQRSVNDSSYVTIADVDTVGGTVSISIADNIGDDLVTYKLFDLDPVAGVPNDSITSISFTGSINSSGRIRLLIASEVLVFSEIFPSNQRRSLGVGVLHLGVQGQPVLMFSSQAMADRTRVAAAVSGDVLGNITAGRITRIQADGRTDPGTGEILGGNIAGDISSTQRDEELNFNADQGALAIGRIVATTSISGDIVAAQPPEFDSASPNVNTASIDAITVGVRRADSGSPIPASVQLTGDILSPAGKIQLIQTYGPIAQRPGRNRVPNIIAGNSIWEIYAGSTSPLVAPSAIDFRAKIKANAIVGPRFEPNADTRDGATRERVIRRIRTAGSIIGNIEADNVASDRYFPLRNDWGIFAGGRIDGAIIIRDRVLTASIVAQRFTGPITIGTFLKGSIIAKSTTGVIPSVTIGRAPLADSLDSRLGFIGSIYPPSASADDPTDNGGLEPDSVIRATAIGSISIPWMSLSDKQFRPRVESPTIGSLIIDRIDSGVVWSGRLENPNNSENDYALVNAITIGCMNRDASLWVRQCPRLSIRGGVAGRVHMPRLAQTEMLVIDGALDPNLSPCVPDCGEFRCGPNIPIGTSEVSPRTSQGRSNTPFALIEIREVSGLKGQIVINAAYGVTPAENAWLGQVVVGSGLASNAITLSREAFPPFKAPYYDIAPGALGGGAVGLVPFRLYEADCEPANPVRPPMFAATLSNYVFPSDFVGSTLEPQPVPVKLRFYGPVVATLDPDDEPSFSVAASPLTSTNAICGLTWNTQLGALFQAADSASRTDINARTIGVTRAPLGPTFTQIGMGNYRIKVNAWCSPSVVTANDPVPVTYWRACDGSSGHTPIAAASEAFHFRVDTQVFIPGNCSACAADFNCRGGVSVQDVFDFLAAWFQGSSCLQPTYDSEVGYVPPCFRGADFNQSGAVGVQDIFDFLAAWFAGC